MAEPRVELAEEFTVTKFPAELRPVIEGFLMSKSMKFEVVGEDNFIATQGSQTATRLIGGWFVGAAKLPKKATIELTTTPVGTEVKARIQETLGFGLLDPKFKKRYEEFFTAWMEELKNALS